MIPMRWQDVVPVMLYRLLWRSWSSWLHLLQLVMRPTWLLEVYVWFVVHPHRHPRHHHHSWHLNHRRRPLHHYYNLLHYRSWCSS